jgi:hypothetical protein
MFFQGLVPRIPAFAGMTASQEGFRPANDTSTQSAQFLYRSQAGGNIST